MPEDQQEKILCRTLYHMLLMLIKGDSAAFTKSQAVERGRGFDA